MLWIVLLEALALVVGALLSVTTVKVSSKERGPGDPAYRFVFTIVWPSGPVTYSWPKRS
jgi:hypothetical protein